MTHDELMQFSRANWQRLPSETREACVESLRTFIPADIRKSWKEHGIGHPEKAGFHILGGGMQIRNRLRSVIKDAHLKPVDYGDGLMARNWDDYYMAAIEEAINE